MPLELRVIYGDTDQMGVVYYANYLRFFEAARGELMRTAGRSYAEFEREGWALPVVEAHVRYRSPARYEDLIRIDLELSELKKVSFQFDYRITRVAEGKPGERGEELLAEGWTVHACLDREGKLIRLPVPLVNLLEETRHGRARRM